MNTDFPFTLPTTLEDRQTVLAQLKSWGKSASQTSDLVGHQLVLHGAAAGAIHDWTFDKAIDEPNLNLHRRDPPIGLFPETHESIYLVKPLRVGPSWASQVWAASFDAGSDDEHANFAVKIFQSSWHPCIDELEVAVGDEELWDKFQEYQREARAYQAYRALQGSAVPYIHGFFRVIMPHNEPAVAIVMERIRKRRVSSADIDLDTAGHGLLDVAHALLQCGCITQDLLTDNVLWPIDPQTGAPRKHPVFIDFSRILENPTLQKVHTHLVRCIYLLRHYGFDVLEIKEWVKKNVGPANTRFPLPERNIVALLELCVDPTPGRFPELDIEVANA